MTNVHGPDASGLNREMIPPDHFGMGDPSRYAEILATLLESIASSILVVNYDLRVVYANRNFLTKSRKNAAGVLGQKLAEVLPQAITENTDLTGAVRRVFAHNQAVRGQRMTYRAPGVPMSVYLYNILPLSLTGETPKVMLLMEDVTEHVRLSEEVRRVERHLASVVESASDVILSTDSDGVVLTWNVAAERLTGCPSYQIVGHPFFERCAPDKKEELTRLFEKLKSGDTPHTGEWDLLAGGGRRIAISWVLSPLKGETGETVGVVASGRDLSERRRLEAQIIHAQKLAALGVMAGGIAHEIRNPLAVCSSAAQFLKNPTIGPELQGECIEKILSGIQRASSIIESLLRFSRPSSESEMTEVDLAEVIRESLRLFRSQAKVEKISISEDYPDVRVAVHGNANLLQQVFLNVFLNALNSMPGGGQMNVSLSVRANVASVKMADTGCGITQEDLDKIFDPFFTLSPAGRGSGLGLSICYSIVKQHLGNIEVHSTVGAGTVFTVELPVL